MPSKVFSIDTVVLLFATALSAVAVALSNQMLEPDSVAYLRIATYYARGDFDLAISAYWGPLISWLTVPVYWVTGDAVLAIRSILVVSAVVFVAGTQRLARVVGGLGAAERVLIAVVAASFAVMWGVHPTTPDFLLAGITTFAVAELLDHRAGVTRRPALAGLLLGTAYLAKTVGLPVALGILIGINGWRVVARIARVRELARSTAISLAVLGAVVVPWIVVLSAHYGQFTWSSAGTINYLFATQGSMARGIAAGPGGPWFDTYHQPDVGRVWSWEDPGTLFYRLVQKAGPVQKRTFSETIEREVNKFLKNARRIHWVTADITANGLGPALLLIGFLVGWPWSSAALTQSWRLLFIPMSVMFCVYLPFHVGNQRYFFGVLPLILVGCVALFLHYSQWMLSLTKIRRHVGRATQLAVLVMILVGYSKSSDILWAIPESLVEPEARYRSNLTAKSYGLARDIAKYYGNQVDGPIAGAMFDKEDWPILGHTDAYVSFLLGVPFYGREIVRKKLNAALESDADFLVIRAGTPLDDRLAHDDRFERLKRAPDAVEPAPASLDDIAIYRVVRSE